ncbi:zinc-dependent metalloprotease [Homoserinibacter gongjuensis]|uniref:Hydrolase n=1 Tax=Homoserinibacter gongjuensis TaxID=1162968 RepID=A0ABQ6JWW7_9MICO|nr:zinc-dependent metalloprotease [Homoserinibacter gongjuensis]GMA91981.1 hydrolase [Homoserinibacter gongjuensis]
MADEPRDPLFDGSENDPGEEFRDMLRDFLAGNSELDPSQLASAAGLPADPDLVKQLIGQLQQALQNSGDGINWSLAQEQATALAARSAVAATPAEVSALEQALHVASLWLDEATDIASLTSEPTLLTRAGWAEATMPVWTQLAEPVADSIATALTRVLEEQAPEELGSMLGDAGRVMRNVGGTLFAMQLGQVVGQLAQEVVSGGDVGIPLLDGEQRQAALVPQNVEGFARGLEVPVEEVRLYLAVRELAHARLFRHAKWLRLQLLTQVTDYARGIHIDTSPLEDLAADFDPTNPEALREALTSGKLIPPKSDEQLAALRRLETMLALIEGWVDVVTAQATSRLPKSDAIAESVRRRRAAGGPAESAFASLVGLELRPRRLREAAAMWQAVTDAVGADARDALWAHPDIIPGDADIDDPTLLVARLTGGEPVQDDVDRALQDLLDDTTGERPHEE